MVYLLQMVILNGYVKEPDGIYKQLNIYIYTTVEYLVCITLHSSPRTICATAAAASPAARVWIAVVQDRSAKMEGFFDWKKWRLYVQD